MTTEWDESDPMAIRRWMAVAGWHSEDRMTWMGWGGGDRIGYSIWFKRWKWHGVTIDGGANSIHGSTDDLSKIPELVAGVAKLARTLYDEYKDVHDVPHPVRMFVSRGTRRSNNNPD